MRRSTKKDASGDLDRCVFNDDEIRAQIKNYEAFITKVLDLLPTKPTPEEQRQIAPTLKKLEEVEEELWILKSRISFADFCQNAITDDDSGEFIQLAPIHFRWVQLLEEHKRLILFSHRNSGKTTLLSIAHSVWELGRDPTLRILVLSNTSEISQRIVKSIANLIKNDPNVKKVFPHLLPNPDGPWTNTQLQVVRNSSSKDPSVRAAGVHGSVTSARIDRIKVDDVQDWENSATEAERRKLLSWYNATVPGCLTRRAREMFVGTAYHSDDLLHTMGRTKGYKQFRFPLVDKNGTITWPEVWSKERVEHLKQVLGPLEWARQGLCVARSDGEARFKGEWIQDALKRGKDLYLIHSLEDLPDDERTEVKAFTGVDLSTGKAGKRTDETSIFTFLQYPNGDRRVAMIEAGKFTGPEIVARVEDTHRRYGSIIAVESNGSQQFLIQFANKQFNVPIIPYTTTKSKRDPILGIEGLAIEMANGKWIIPACGGETDPQVERFINECLFFDPKTHPGDRLMSSFFAREIARRFAGEARTGPQASFRVLGPTDPTPGSEEPYRESPSLRKMFDIPDMP